MDKYYLENLSAFINLQCLRYNPLPPIDSHLLSIFCFIRPTAAAVLYQFSQHWKTFANIPMRKYRWSLEEEEYLKLLREERKIKSWKEIASELNARFSQSSKSSKQCRQKYINYSRFCVPSKKENSQSWTAEDDKKLSYLYNEFGSTWSSFTLNLIDKSENSIKNRFYNRLKKLAKKLDDHRSMHSEQIRGSSSYESMIRILDFSNQVRAFSINNKLMMNPESALIKTRLEILHCCFDHTDEEEVSCENLCSLIRRMKEVNIKIRCFGICKAKNRKNWKLTKRGFDSTLQFDQQAISGIKVENKQEKQPESDTPNKQEVSERNQNKSSVETNEYLPFMPYYYMNPMNPYSYFMMPPHPMMAPNFYPEFSVKMQQNQMNFPIMEDKMKHQQN